MIEKLNGIVIKNIKYLGSDRILTVFTKEKGKVTIMAKRAASAKSKLLAAVSAFTYSEFICYPGKKFYTLNSATYIKAFHRLSSELERTLYAGYMAELTDIFYEDKLADMRAFNLLYYSLKLLENEKLENTPFITLAFMLKLLGINGSAPALEKCVMCENSTNETYYFDFSNGGIVCDKCTENFNELYKLNKKQINLINELLYMDLSKLKNKDFKAYKNSLINYLIQVINDYIVYTMGRKTKSFDFLADVTFIK